MTSSTPGSRRRASRVSSPRRPAAAAQVVAGVGQRLQLAEHGGGDAHRAVQEAGPYDVEDPAVDRDRGVDEPRQRPRSPRRAGGRPALAPKMPSMPSRRTAPEPEAEHAEDDQHEDEDRGGDVGLRDEHQQRPGQGGRGDQPADHADAAGHQRLGRDRTQGGLGPVDHGHRRAGDHTTEDVAHTAADDAADRCSVERAEHAGVAAGHAARDLVPDAREEDDHEQPQQLHHRIGRGDFAQLAHGSPLAAEGRGPQGQGPGQTTEMNQASYEGSMIVRPLSDGIDRN